MTTEKILIEQRFSSHMEVHSSIDTIGTCTICKEKFKDGHMATRHGEDFPRDYCDTCFRVIIKPCCGSENPSMKLTKLKVKDSGLNR